VSTLRIAKVEAFVLRSRQPSPYWGSHIYSPESERWARALDEFGRGDLSSVYPIRSTMLGHYPRELTALLVKITTDDGINGWGESKATLAPSAVKAIIEEILAPALLEQDPQQVEVLHSRMQGLMKLRGHMQGFFQEALSGVDIALWDLQGKSLGVPVWKLLGGRFAHRARVYASSLVGLPPSPDEGEVRRLREEAARIAEMGFRAVKIGLRGGIRNDIETVRVVRESLGSDFLIFVDAGGLYDRLSALELARQLKRYEVGWLEAPLHFTDLEGYLELSRRSEVPIACDVIWSQPVILSLLKRGARIIFQPDVIKAGGITAMKKLARLCEAFGLPIAPHLAQGTPLQFAATYHVAVSSVNCLISEYWYQPNPFAKGLFLRMPKLEDGCLIMEEGPGLGVEINEEALRQHGKATPEA
jgi:L-alanine-DL-glutamate epimerase-like enolase superfamily enzyme